MMKSLYKRKEDSSKLSYLRSTKGPGICLIIFASNQELFKKKSLRLPEEILDLDVRGGIDINGANCRISIGEIKTSPDGKKYLNSDFYLVFV